MKKQHAVIPHSLKEALYTLQNDPLEREWGGGIDFEIIGDKPQIERILAYYGEKYQIPSRIIGKYADDVEISFHTHPTENIAMPSTLDLLGFINSKQQIEFIVANSEIYVLEKTRNTPTTTTEEEIERLAPEDAYDLEDRKMQKTYTKDIKEHFNIRSTIIPRKKDLSFSLNTIKGI